MTTFSSKQEKRQGLVLVSMALIGVLVAFGSLSGSLYSPVRNALATQGGAADSVSINDGASFASDLHYWNAECSHGWTADSTCDTLVLRIQSCAIGAGSAYCSEYDTYLQQFRGQ